MPRYVKTSPLRSGGTIIYCYMPRGWVSTVEGDESMMQRWAAGDTGKGKFIVYPGDGVPAEFYSDFIRQQLEQQIQPRAVFVTHRLPHRKKAEYLAQTRENVGVKVAT